MPKFQAGDPNKPKGGRPKGSKDKSYLTLQYWYNELQKDWDKLKPSQRAKLSAQLMQMLTNKMKALPNSQEQSVLNAKDAMALLEEAEGKNKGTTQSNEVNEPINLTPPDNIA